jgi:sugar (pentulose or hexulose) kinase
MKFLSIDIGTSSVKAAMVGGDLEVMRFTKKDYQIRTINVDWVELDGDVVLKAVIDAIRDLPGSSESDMVVFDNFSPTPMLMDHDGNPLYPIITHLDRRSKKQTQEILRDFGHDRFQAITGIQPFTGGSSITSLLWLKENCPDQFSKCHRIGHASTFLYKRLAGKWAIDTVNASMTGMYETLTGNGWSEEICHAFDIPMGMLPEVLQAGVATGKLTDEIAGLSGLKSGTPVALGTNDATAAQIGAGNRMSGDILNICGSSDMVSILTDKPIANDSYYLRCFCLPGLWQIFATTAGGFAIDWFREQFCREMSARQFFDEELENALANCEKGMAVGYAPYLSGDRQSVIPKKASLTGLTLDTTRLQMLSAILLGMHQPMIDVIGLCERNIELRKKIKLTGGLLSPGFIDLKRRLFKDYEFEVIQDCPLKGNVALAIGQ